MKISLEEILAPDNINDAMNDLQKKNNSAGLDGIKLSELPEYWKANHANIIDSIISGKYEPEIVQNVEIIMANGKRRTISKIASVDRLILRSMAQKMAVAAEPTFSKNSYAYQEGKGTFAAACQAVKYLNAGNAWCAEIDVENFFDNISHTRLMDMLNEYADEKVTNLIAKYLKCRILEDNLVFQKNIGLIQGSSLSPVLSNVYMNELDYELERKGLFFCRFADNINVYAKTLAEASCAFEEVENLLRVRLGLKVNKAKSGTFLAHSRKYLGYYFEQKEGQGYIARKYSRNNTYYNKWQTSAVQQIDREYHLINDGILTRKDFKLNVNYHSYNGEVY